ncbi:MAG: hypothetical protein QM770_01410 [Tepidisphaeraceae bacterium]
MPSPSPQIIFEYPATEEGHRYFVRPSATPPGRSEIVAVMQQVVAPGRSHGTTWLAVAREVDQVILGQLRERALARAALIDIDVAAMPTALIQSAFAALEQLHERFPSLLSTFNRRDLERIVIPTELLEPFADVQWNRYVARKAKALLGKPDAPSRSPSTIGKWLASVLALVLLVGFGVGGWKWMGRHPIATPAAAPPAPPLSMEEGAAEARLNSFIRRKLAGEATGKFDGEGLYLAMKDELGDAADAAVPKARAAFLDVATKRFIQSEDEYTRLIPVPGKKMPNPPSGELQRLASAIVVDAKYLLDAARWRSPAPADVDAKVLDSASAWSQLFDAKVEVIVEVLAEKRSLVQFFCVDRSGQKHDLMSGPTTRGKSEPVGQKHAGSFHLRELQDYQFYVVSQPEKGKRVELPFSARTDFHGKVDSAYALQFETADREYRLTLNVPLEAVKTATQEDYLDRTWNFTKLPKVPSGQASLDDAPAQPAPDRDPKADR